MAAATRRALSVRADAALRTLLSDAAARGQVALPDVETAIARLLGPLVFRRPAQGLPLGDAFLAEVVDAFLRGMPGRSSERELPAASLTRASGPNQWEDLRIWP